MVLNNQPAAATVAATLTLEDIMMKLQNNGDNAILIADACNAIARCGLRFLNPGDKLTWSAAELSRSLVELMDVIENGDAPALLDFTQGIQNIPFPLYAHMARMQDSMPEKLYQRFSETLKGSSSVIDGGEYKVVGFRQLDAEQQQISDAADSWLDVPVEIADVIARDMELEAADGSRFFLSSGATFMKGCTINGVMNIEYIEAADGKEIEQ